MNPIPPPTHPTNHAAWAVWSNPIFRRYCQARLRPRGAGIALLLTLLIAGFIVAMVSTIGTRNHMSPADIARAGIIPLLVVQALILFVLGTAQVAGGMTAERDEGVIDYQRLIPMSPLAKVLGYLFGLPVREYVMVGVTLPFTGWCLWRGQVAWDVWLPLYAVVLSSAWLYHVTGLLTGTVARNRRWAFLASIGLVFCLYTVIPQMAKFGLVFFKYLTITPVFQECLPGLLKFFNLDFSEALFTGFSQGGLILTFVIMLCRKWRRAESHLLGKLWATGFFMWIQLLLLGNALPLIEPGTLFPTRGLASLARYVLEWTPNPAEAVAMAGVYGLVTLALICVLGGIITPSADHQLRGWRRARKQGAAALPRLADAATAYWWVVVMALAGATGWFLFTRALVGSHWFPGHAVPLSTLGLFAAVMLSGGCGFQALLEAKGGRSVALAGILVAVVPLMIGAVCSAVSGMVTTAVWVIGMSPLSLPFYAVGSQLSIVDLPEEVTHAVTQAFYCWLGLGMAVMLWLSWRLWVARSGMAGSGMAQPPALPRAGSVAVPVSGDA